MAPTTGSSRLLAGKTIAVTGATGHLGASIASALHGYGATVVLHGRDASRVEATATRLGVSHTTPRLVFDLQDLEAMRRNIGSLQTLDGLVNNAFRGPVGSMAQMPVEVFRSGIELGLTSQYALLREVAPKLIATAQRGQDAFVVNIGSMYGRVSPDLRVYSNENTANPPSYGAAKAALSQLTRYAAAELGAAGVRVNSVSPGPFPNREVQRDQPSFVEALAERTMLRRIGQPDEVAGPVVFLCSELARYVTGHDLVVDGGWTVW